MHLLGANWLRGLTRMVLLVAVLPGTVTRAQTATTTALTISPSTSPLAPQTVVTLTATVTAGVTPVHPGLVTFCDATASYCIGLAVLGTAQLTSDGTAVLRFIPGSGSHSYKAIFAGTSTNTASTSTPQAVTVSPPTTFPTTTAITFTGSAGNYTLTATVVGIGNATLGPTSSVSFIDTTNSNSVVGAATLGPSTLGRGFANAPGSPIAVGGAPLTAAVGDFNGDGIADLAVPDPESNNVIILLGDGNGGFTPVGSPVAVGAGPISVVVADFNSDSIADLAVTNSSDDTVSILLGDGHGGFTPAMGSPVAVGSFPQAVAVGDFNRDGIADLAVANAGDRIMTILLGNGHGGFTSVGSPPVVGRLNDAVAVGDFTGDGIADLAVVSNLDNNVTILRGNGDGTFAQIGSPIAVGINPFAVAVGNFNGDGIADLAVPSHGPEDVRILLGNGDGTFMEMLPRIASGTSPSGIAVGDFNGDRIADLAVTNYSDDSVSIFKGNGDGTFTEVLPRIALGPGSGPVGVTVGNFNGDGAADLVVPNSNDVSILLDQVTQTATTVLSGVSIPGSGTHNVNATYTGDTNFIASTSQTIPLTATQVPTVTTLVLSTADTIASGTPVILTADVAPYTAGSVRATGTISFHDGAALLGTATISPMTGEASLMVPSGTIPAFALGAHSLTAVYAGDTNFLASTSSSVSLTVMPLVAVALASSPNPSAYGQVVTFTATVPTGVTGTIQFRNGAVNLGSPLILEGTTAAMTLSTLAQGVHPITAAYSGDGSHAPATSDALNQLITPAILTVTATNSTRTFNQPNATLSYTITGFVGRDTPSVVTGVASVSTTATPTSPVGIYPITVTPGTLSAANYIFAFLNGSLTVTKATGSVTLAVPTTPSVGGSPVMLTAMVPSGATGTVTFYEGTTALGTATISGTTATLMVSTFVPGPHTITAVYNGDTNFAPASSSPAILVVVAAPDFMVASSTGRQLIPPGASASYTIVVSSINGPFTNSVTMSASSLPPGASYTFNPATVTPGVGGANTTFTVSVPKQSSVVASRASGLGSAALALLLLPFACLKRHRARPQRLLLWILVTLTSLGAVSGCGEGGYFSQTEQTYTITLTGTSGSAVRSTTVTLTVE
jgi:Bacterial Ig-like domain (group 3)/MBG domain (YGX type)/FG-GAP-like repeat/FG-GAP repeat